MGRGLFSCLPLQAHTRFQFFLPIYAHIWGWEARSLLTFWGHLSHAPCILGVVLHFSVPACWGLSTHFVIRFFPPLPCTCCSLPACFLTNTALSSWHCRAWTHASDRRTRHCWEGHSPPPTWDYWEGTHWAGPPASQTCSKNTASLHLFLACPSSVSNFAEKLPCMRGGRLWSLCTPYQLISTHALPCSMTCLPTFTPPTKMQKKKT